MTEHFPRHGVGAQELTIAERELTDLALLTLLEQRDTRVRATSYLEHAELMGFSDPQIDEALIRAAKEIIQIDREMEAL